MVGYRATSADVRRVGVGAEHFGTGSRVMDRSILYCSDWLSLNPHWASRELLGNAAFLVFTALQVLDGFFTYCGVSLSGIPEGNPLLARLMVSLGVTPALATVKVLATAFGAVLHLFRVHRIVATLALIYLLFAIGPWTRLLFAR